jgi:hypothetical protein
VLTFGAGATLAARFAIIDEMGFISRLAYSARRVAFFASYSRALFGQNEIVAGSRETRRSWAKIAECHKGKRK